PPRAHPVLVDRPHDALGIGVGAGNEVESFVLRWMDGVTVPVGDVALVGERVTAADKRPIFRSSYTLGGRPGRGPRAGGPQGQAARRPGGQGRETM
ncbi:MAG: hypothetical protein ACK5M9_11175, partial [Mycobacterium sp.]